ncbi:MAG: Stk1 family PASTA domain-containing Ser/Thr kinase [Clostridiales bacterium]|nr:Stk1 family PASTA domain-containing Ser/Thr kinase [Clostridiales bacterium]
MLLNEGDIISERYEIIGKLGSGGMAIVYKALDKKLNRPVTFKVMREEHAGDENYIKRFLKEARAAASISHQNLVNIYDAGSDGGVHYITMEYIDGFTLKDMINRKAPFTNEETLGVAIQIAAALEHAHNNQIVHRDIKPQNILIDTDGMVKVTDFGIARAASDNTQTKSLNTMGSVHYFSPEQARGGYTDNKSDIYSLGIVMFEMASGLIPFDGDTPVSIALRHINDPLPDIRKVNPSVSESLARIIEKATEKTSANRYQSIDAMSDDLKRALTNSTGDFVNKSEFNSGDTVRFTDNEMAKIRSDAKAIFLGEDKPDAEEKQPPRKIDLEYDDEYEEYEEEDDDDYAEEDPEASYKTAERKVIAAAIITSIAVIGISLAVVLNGLNKGGKPVATMANVVGQPLISVQTEYKELGLTVTNTETRKSSEYPEGVIIEQFVPEGEPLYRDTSITVAVSGGAPDVSVPDLRYKSLDELDELLSGVPLELKKEYTADDHTPIDVVARQEPEAGAEVPPGSTVTVYVSSGPNITNAQVPALVGETEARAKELIQDSGFRTGSISQDFSSTYDKGIVMYQSVPAGSMMPAETTAVGITVSAGAESAPEITTPDKPRALSGKESSRTLTLNPTALPSGDSVVEYRVTRMPPDYSTQETVAQAQAQASAFPVTIEVTGSGNQEFIFSIFDKENNSWKLQQRFEVDFSEEQVSPPDLSDLSNGTD